MDLDLLRSSVGLAPDATLRLDVRLGERVECLAGTLWLTQDGDPRDVVLAAGEGFTVDRAGGAVVSAIGEPGARFLRLAAGAAATAAVA